MQNIHSTGLVLINLTVKITYSQTRLILALLIRHFRLIRQGNFKTLKPLQLTSMLVSPVSSSQNVRLFWQRIKRN